MDDKEILHHITELVNEEHELMNLAEGTGLDDEQQARIKALEISLDQCWDLLRQHRARAKKNEKKGSFHRRPPKIVPSMPRMT